MSPFPSPERGVLGINLTTSLERSVYILTAQLGVWPVSGVNKFAGEDQAQRLCHPILFTHCLRNE